MVAVEAGVEEDEEDLNPAAFEIQDLHLLGDGAHHIVALRLAVKSIHTFHVVVVGEGLTLGPDLEQDPCLALLRAHHHVAEGMTQAHPSHLRLPRLDPHREGDQTPQEQREEDQILPVNQASDLEVVQTHHALGHLEDDHAQHGLLPRVAAGVPDTDTEEDDLTQVPRQDPGLDRMTGGVVMERKMSVGEDLHQIHLTTEETDGLILSGADQLAMTAV